MRTIPDSNVVLDLLDSSSTWYSWSRQWFSRCSEEGDMIVNAVVLAEATGRFQDYQDALAVVRGTGLTFEHMPIEAAHLAGQAHYQYRRSGGRRERVLPDFLIGAHAAVSNYRILSRDQARFRTYFPSVPVVAPDSHP